jgi:folate-dependent phosphoribosylglycinamide formyltransferase PurN
MKNWIALFSQTGSEIVELSKILKRTPDYLITNNYGDKIPIHAGIKDMNVPIITADHKFLMELLKRTTSFDPAVSFIYVSDKRKFEPLETLVTLHGYLRILPTEICDKYTIYNGHPANIEEYPELKGKDPQERTWINREKYPTIGSVVHRCTPELDGGEIVSRHYVNNTCTTKEALYQRLRECSIHAWEIFLKEQLCA